MRYRRVASLKTAEEFLAYLAEIGVDLPFDDEIDHGPNAPLAQSCTLQNGFRVGNRIAALPMEGWDGTSDGRPTKNTTRRWRRFGQSGAKLIWGGEAVAVRHDGRANPHQLLLNEKNAADFARLRENLVAAHRQAYERSDDLFIGLQLTHSGRFSRPNRNDKLESKILYAHPFLDKKFSAATCARILSDDEISQLEEDFVGAAKLAASAGFDFIDIKLCHGYLGHEFLSAIDRPGKYGGSFENRTRFLREIVAGIQAEVPQLEIGVRLSAFDFVPYHTGANGRGEPERLEAEQYRHAFGGDGTGLGIDTRETVTLLQLLQSLGIQLVCITAGSPYYNPHIQRPALFPPSDGYQPPEDPLAGVARLISVTANLKKAMPELIFVGSGYSYLQEWFIHVAQSVVRQGLADFVGLGRMLLTYPEFAMDAMAGKPLDKRRICRTFSDCTTAPRNSLISGCYPLDEYYKAMPEAQILKQLKKTLKQKK